MLVKVTRDAGFKQKTAAPFIVAFGIESIFTAAIIVVSAKQPLMVCINNFTSNTPVYAYKCCGFRLVVSKGEPSPKFQEKFCVAANCVVRLVKVTNFGPQNCTGRFANFATTLSTIKDLEVESLQPLLVSTYKLTVCVPGVL